MGFCPTQKEAMTNKTTKAELEKTIKELQTVNNELTTKNMQLSFHMREAAENGNRWREQFWLLMKLSQAYVARVPDKSNGDVLAQAKMIASIDPESSKWSVFWSPTETTKSD